MDRRRNSYGARDSYGGGGYGSSRSGSQSSRGSRDGYSSQDRGTPYRGRGGGRGGGSRGGYGAPGGRSGADDSTTTSFPEVEPQLFSIPELEQLPPIPSKTSTTVRTNGYEIDVSKAQKVYQYDIKWTGESKKGKKFDMNKQTKDDIRLQLKQNALLSVFYKTFLPQYKDFFRITEGDEEYIFDSGSMFFCQTKLLEDEEVRAFDLEVEKFDQIAKEYYRSMVKGTAELRFTREIQLDSLNGILENDRPVIQFLELVFSQAQRQGGDYLSFGNRFFEIKSNEEIERTPMVLKEGVTRSIRIIGEPSDKKLMVQMVPTKTTFYDSRSLERLIAHAINGRISDITNENKRKIASAAIKGLVLRTTHLERNNLLVSHGLTIDGANRCFFEYNGKETDVAQYFYEKYHIRLQYPGHPCVIEKKGRNKSFYPIEVLRIPENQRVPKAKQGNDLNALIIRKCQMLPSIAVKKVEKNREDAEIFNSNLIIRKTAARVEPRKLVSAPANQIPTPSIVFENTQKSLKNGLFGMQTGDKFIHPATVQKLACVLASDRLEPYKAENFVNQFLRRVELYGVRVERHNFFDWSNPDRDSENLEDYAKKGFDFALIIGDSDQLHHKMKHIELGTRLPTQHVTTKTVLKANNTLYDNLAYKFNLKARGINWGIGSDPSLVSKLQNRDLLKSLLQNTLFFGIDLSHPVGRADPNLKPEHVDPTCVGFASNLYKGQANMSKGDFGYQRPQKTIVNAALLEAKFDAAINAYYRNSGRYPSWIVVYRSGLSEAEVQKVQDAEVPVLKATIEKFKAQSTEFKYSVVKLTVIMANTKTNFRLFKDEIDPQDKAPFQNVPSGTCVSEKIVSRRVPYFILVAQRTLIGTARPAVYHVLEGADAFPLDQIRYVTYCLCFSHGIVGSPTKLPGPLVSAADLSKRARNNFRQHKLNGNDDTGSVTNGDSSRYRQGQGDILTEEEKKQLDSKEEEHYDQMNNILKAAIQEGRFWA